MRKRVLQLGGVTIAALAAAAFSFGGWAVITVDDLPQALTVGHPTSIGFMVRQHGHAPLNGLTPTIVASAENTSVRPRSATSSWPVSPAWRGPRPPSARSTTRSSGFL